MAKNATVLFQRREIKWQTSLCAKTSMAGRVHKSAIVQNQFEIPVLFLCPCRAGDRGKKPISCCRMEMLFRRNAPCDAYVFTTSNSPAGGHSFLRPSICFLVGDLRGSNFFGRPFVGAIIELVFYDAWGSHFRRQLKFRRQSKRAKTRRRALKIGVCRIVSRFQGIARRSRRSSSMRSANRL